MVLNGPITILAGCDEAMHFWRDAHQLRLQDLWLQYTCNVDLMKKDKSLLCRPVAVAVTITHGKMTLKKKKKTLQAFQYKTLTGEKLHMTVLVAVQRLYLSAQLSKVAFKLV